MEEECVICLTELDATAVRLSCGHRLHSICLQRHLQTDRRGRCPVCRRVVHDTTPRLNVDRTAAPSKAVVVAQSVTTSVAADATPHLGITVGDAPHHHHGVVVRRVHRNDAAYRAGLRPGDVLTHVNGIPCASHAQVIAMLEGATHEGRAATCTLRRPLSSRMGRWASRLPACAACVAPTSWRVGARRGGE